MEEQRIVDPREHEDQCARELFESECKKAINELIWLHMPSSLTLGEADDIAGAIHDMFSDAWNKHADAKLARRSAAQPVTRKGEP